MTSEFITRVTKKLNQNNIEYFITGGTANYIRGKKKFTKDLDIVVKLNDKNLKLLSNFIAELGIKDSIKLKELRQNRIVRIHLFPFFIDIMPQLDGLNIENTFFRIENYEYEKQILPLISEEDLIKNYKAINQ
jgi:predicted nucleotidyltransferase